MVIGKQFKELGYLINGIEVNVRKGRDKICPWTCKANDEQSILKIGREISCNCIGTQQPTSDIRITIN